MMTVEYATVASLFFIAYESLVTLALVIQMLFLAAEVFVELVLYKALGLPFKGKYESKIAGCINISCFHIPMSVFRLVTLMPNYVHVVNSAIVAGESYKTWDEYPNIETSFKRNWRSTAAIGSTIGVAGIPSILTGLLIASM